MNYSQIFFDDTRNGHGFRITLGVSGCDLKPHCKNCFNKSSWDFNSGELFNNNTKQIILNELKKPYIRGLSIIGGDPISNVLRDDTLTDLVKTIKKEFCGKTIYAWTGYTYENIIKNNKIKEFLSCVDMLRDGRYIEELRDVKQYLQGSKNQRYINVQESIEKGRIIEFEEFKGVD